MPNKRVDRCFPVLSKANGDSAMSKKSALFKLNDLYVIKDQRKNRRNPKLMNTK